MKIQHFMHAGLLLTTLSFMLSGCGKENDNSMNSGNNSTAKISGRVTNNAGFGNSLSKTAASVEGATVSVLQVQSDGSLQVVSKTNTTTDVNGRFTVETELSGESGLIILAEKDAKEWKAVVSAEVTTGDTTKCQPHNDEASTEAETYEDIKGKDFPREKHNSITELNQTENAFYTEIAAYVTADVAASVGNDASQISELATAINAQIEAMQLALLHAEIGASSQEIETADQKKMEAQVQLESDLCLAAGNETQANIAMENYANAIIDAYIQANINAESYAKAREISGSVLLKNSSGLNANTALMLKRSNAIVRGRARTEACETQFSDIDSSGARINAIVTAGSNLNTDLQNAQSESDINTAFEIYHNIIIDELKIAISGQATAITTIDALLNGVGGAKTVLNATLSTAVSTEAVINAYIDFYAAVGTLVESTLATATSVEIRAASEIMILANL